jgi:RNA polymerase sigma-70 factor (ECF subfamily)
MAPDDLNARLSAISTQWTRLFQAHREPGEAGTPAMRELVLRYYGAVYRYLLGALRDPAAAEELTQDFAVRFLRGDFKRADPGRGRFRDFLKTALRNLALDHWRKRAAAPGRLDSSAPVAGEPPPTADDLDRAFLDKWREELLRRAWEGLAKVEDEAGKPYHTLLRYKAARPRLRSAELAEYLGTRLGRPVTVAALRQLLHRAREQFAELLVQEVAWSLQTADPERLAQELIDLDLLDYCRSALARRGRGPS